MHAKALSYKSNQFLILTVKISIIACSFYVIYSKMDKNMGIHHLQHSALFQIENGKTINLWLFILLCSFINWGLEFLKWQQLVKPIKTIAYATAGMQTLGAHAASLFTPNRIGDYGAKALYFPKYLRTRVMTLNAIGNISQMLITCILGGYGLLALLKTYPSINLLHTNYSIVYAIIICSCLGIYCILKHKASVQHYFKKLKVFLSSISKATLLTTICISLLRYAVFSFQFYFILICLKTEISYLQAMMLISSMYLLASVIPSLFIFDVVLKGGIAVYLFSILNIPESVVLSTVTLMWFCNTVLPSVIGYYAILKFKPITILSE